MSWTHLLLEMLTHLKIELSLNCFVLLHLFSVAKATLQLQMSACLSVCPSVHYQNPSCLSEVQPISHHANQPSCQSATSPPPLSASQNHNYRPSYLSAIMPIWPSDLCPAFKTFKPLRLVSYPLTPNLHIQLWYRLLV